jgi:hypothetical protein
VRLGGIIYENTHRAVATERTVLGMVGCTGILHEFGCQAAEGALTAAGITDCRSWNIIATKRRWVSHEATRAELAAAEESARATYMNPGGNATRPVQWIHAMQAIERATHQEPKDAAWGTAIDAAWAAVKETPEDTKPLSERRPGHIGERLAKFDIEWAKLGDKLGRLLNDALPSSILAAARKDG